MSSSYITSGGDVVQLDGRAPPPLVITSVDVQDPEKLSRLLEDAHRKIQALERRANLSRIYFRDVTVDATGTTKYRFEHRLGGRVNFWTVAWSTGSAAPNLRLHADTTSDALVITSTVAGVVTLLVEEAR